MIRAAHARLSGIQSGDLEKSVSLLDMSDLNNWLKVHPGNRLGQSDDGLKLSNSDRDAISLLVDSLVL